VEFKLFFTISVTSRNVPSALSVYASKCQLSVAVLMDSKDTLVIELEA
jgi:hypothetical protein